jgi:MFS family permease
MTTIRATNATNAKSDALRALPIVAAVFVVYFVIGIAMPVLPLHVARGLGFGSLMVGVVAGAQFAAALVSRLWSGRAADRRGGKWTVVAGMIAAAVSGLFYLASVVVDAPSSSVALLVAGRALLGGAESFIVTGALAWALSLVGASSAGRVMSWVGTAMYIAFAAGAPAGTVLYAKLGFVAVGACTVAVPLIALALVLPVRGVVPLAQQTHPLKATVLRAVWIPGAGLALSAVGFGAITTFVVLLFAEHEWGAAWLAFTLMSGAFVIGRLFFGHLPDRIGGAKVALVSVVIEACGQLCIWAAPSSTVALAGAALTGFGYALVYPAFGVEALRRAPPQSRGLAVGAYTAALDLALGVANPLLGLVASRMRVDGVFIVSTVVVATAVFVAARLLGPARLSRETVVVPAE